MNVRNYNLLSFLSISSNSFLIFWCQLCHMQSAKVNGLRMSDVITVRHKETLYNDQRIFLNMRTWISVCIVSSFIAYSLPVHWWSKCLGFFLSNACFIIFFPSSITCSSERNTYRQWSMNRSLGLIKGAWGNNLYNWNRKLIKRKSQIKWK